MLERGDTVQAIALELGYSTASAFIAMFRRQGGGTRPVPPRHALKKGAECRLVIWGC
jgi:transcriptional regulator GlxA family with amidase domain